jgi:hypothetical protein
MIERPKDTIERPGIEARAVAHVDDRAEFLAGIDPMLVARGVPNGGDRRGRDRV